MLTGIMGLVPMENAHSTAETARSRVFIRHDHQHA